MAPAPPISVSPARSKRFCGRSALVSIVAATLAAWSLTAGGQTPPRAGAAPISIEAAAAARKEEAIRLLSERGLTATGRHWLSPEDARLRRQLDSLERLQKQFHQTRKALDQRIEENETAGRALAELERKVEARQALLSSTADPAVRRQATDELSRLTSATTAGARYLPPEQFAEDAAVRTTLIEWIGARNSLAIIALGYPAAISQVNRGYIPLRKDAEIQNALAVLGRKNELGGGRNLAAAAPQIEDAKRVALAADAPLYRVSGQWRTSLLLEDAAPVACTLVDQGPPLLLPESVARAVGVSLDAKAPLRRYIAADGRQFDVRVAQLKQIRLGGRMFSNVEALVLPPEGEDLGVVLSRHYLGGIKLQLQPQRLSLILGLAAGR